MIIHTLSIKRGVHQATQVHDCPWLLCEPNEVEGRKLLAEIMQGCNFGQYDTRDAALKKGGMMKHGLWKLKRVMRLVSSYPEEAYGSRCLGCIISFGEGLMDNDC